MGKFVYFVNAFFGILVGLAVGFMSTYAQIRHGFVLEMFMLLVAAILSVWFGVYQWKKFRAAS